MSRLSKELAKVQNYRYAHLFLHIDTKTLPFYVGKIMES